MAIPRLKVGNDIDSATLNRWADQVQQEQRQLAQEVSNAAKKAETAIAVAGTAVPSTTQALPNQVTSISISENGYIIDGVVWSELTVTYTAPNPLGTFAGVYLVIKDYRSSTELVKIGEHRFGGVAGGSGSFKVTLQRTGETVTLYLVAKNSDGAALADWALCPSTTVVLDGNASAPTAPTGLVGQQTELGVWLVWNENSEQNLKAYNVYRHTANVPASAINIGSVGATTTGTASFFDKTASTGTTYYYWVTAVNTALQESAKSGGVSSSGLPVSASATAYSGGATVESLKPAEAGAEITTGKNVEYVYNPRFELGDTSWSKETGWAVVSDPANAYQGNWVGRFQGTGAGAMRNANLIAARQGDVIHALGMVKRTVGNGTISIRISWLNSSSVEFATTYGNAVTSSSYEVSRVIGTAPANTAFARVEAVVLSASIATTAFVDQVTASHFPRDLDEIGDGIAYKRTTLNEKTGAGRAYDGIGTGGITYGDKWVRAAPKDGGTLTNFGGGLLGGGGSWLNAGSFTFRPGEQQTTTANFYDCRIHVNASPTGTRRNGPCKMRLYNATNGAVSSELTLTFAATAGAISSASTTLSIAVVPGVDNVIYVQGDNGNAEYFDSGSSVWEDAVINYAANYKKFTPIWIE